MQTTHRLLLSLSLVALLCPGCKRKTIREQFAEAAAQETRQRCPTQIDEYTTLDSIVYDKDTNTQAYYYSVQGELNDSAFYTPYIRAEWRETMLISLRNEIKLKKYMQEGVNFLYSYRSKNTQQALLEIRFTQADYKGRLTKRPFAQRTQQKWQDYTQKHCPERQDECTTLNKVEYLAPDSTLHYVYALQGELDVENFSETFPLADKELKRMLTDGIRENEALKEEREGGLHFLVDYQSASTGRTLLSIRIENQELREK